MLRTYRHSHQQIVSALLKKIRGSTSQAHLSAKLGLNHNHVYKWEAGIRKIQWVDFVKLCQLKKIDLSPLLFDLYFFRGNISDAAAIFQRIFMGISAKSLSPQLGVSRFRIDSWLRGKGPFYLQDLICTFDRFSHYLAEFSLFFFTLDEVKRIGIDLTEYQNRQFEAESPLISLVLRALETKSHIQSNQASPKFVSQLLGLEEDEVKSLLGKASSLGLVSKKGNKYLSENLHIDLRGKKAIKQRRFWIETALQFIDQGKIVAPDYIFGNIVYCISQGGQNRILDEYLQFYNKARKIIETDGDGGDIPTVLNFQMLKMRKK